MKIKLVDSKGKSIPFNYKDRNSVGFEIPIILSSKLGIYKQRGIYSLPTGIFFKLSGTHPEGKSIGISIQTHRDISLKGLMIVNSEVSEIVDGQEIILQVRNIHPMDNVIPLENGSVLANGVFVEDVRPDIEVVAPNPIKKKPVKKLTKKKGG